MPASPVGDQCLLKPEFRSDEQPKDICEWLEDKLRAERRAIEEDLAQRHEEVLCDLAGQLQSLLCEVKTCRWNNKVVGASPQPAKANDALEDNDSCGGSDDERRMTSKPSTRSTQSKHSLVHFQDGRACGDDSDELSKNVARGSSEDSSGQPFKGREDSDRQSDRNSSKGSVRVGPEPPDHFVAPKPPEIEAPELQSRESSLGARGLVLNGQVGSPFSLKVPQVPVAKTVQQENEDDDEDEDEDDAQRASFKRLSVKSDRSSGGRKCSGDTQRAEDWPTRRESYETSTGSIAEGSSSQDDVSKSSRMATYDKNRRKSTYMARGFDQVVLKSQQNQPSTWLNRIVTNPRFELFFALLILLNTVIMALQAQYEGMNVAHEIGVVDISGSDSRPAEKIWPNATVIWDLAEWVFGVFFTIELVVKIAGLKKQFYQDAWNIFDSIIVLCWLVTALEAVQLPINPTLLRLTRLVRLLRLLRLVKTIQGFDSLYLMTASIRSSLSALGWSSALLFIGELMMALILQVVLEEYYLKDETIALEDRIHVYEYFGTFSRSLLSMFEMMFGNWYNITRMLVTYVSEWFMIYGVAHQLFLGFAVVEVITGIFFHETFKVASMDDAIMMAQKTRQNKVHEEKITALFEHADRDHSGTLDRDEFRQILGNKEVQTWLAAMDLDVSDVDTVFSLLHDENLEVSAKNLVEGVARLKGPARSVDLSALLQKIEELEARLNSRIEREFTNSRRLMVTTPSMGNRPALSPRVDMQPSPVGSGSPDSTWSSPTSVTQKLRRASTEGPAALLLAGQLSPTARNPFLCASPPALSPRPGGLKKNASVSFLEATSTPMRVAKATRTLGKFSAEPKPALIVSKPPPKSETDPPGGLPGAPDT